MQVILILGGVALGLFVVSFVSKRRFGLLGLGLSAGAILSPLWSDTAGLLISATGLVPEGPATTGLSIALVMLVPSIVLLFQGYKYKSIFGRIVGSLLYVVLAFAFLSPAIGSTFTLDGPFVQAQSWLASHKDMIIGVGIGVAVLDILVSRPAHKEDKKHHH